MRLFSIELFKIIRRKFSLWLLMATTIVFPILIYVVSYLHVVEDEVSVETLTNEIAGGVVEFSQIFIFLPAWIIVFVGMEITGGYVNRVVFYSSKVYYLNLKISYCLLVSIYFGLLGTLSFIMTMKMLPTQAVVAPLFYLMFGIQLLFSSFFYSIFLVGLTFICKSPIVTSVVYIGWSTIETAIYTLFNKLYGVKLFWLPLHLLKSLHNRDNAASVRDYYNPFMENVGGLLLPTLFALVVLGFLYYFFPKSNLKPLSD